MALVGLVGYAQSGKDTFGNALGWHRIAFGDALKDLALKSGPMFKLVDLRSAPPIPLSFIVEEWGWEFAKAKVPGVREYLQDLGQGARQVLGDDVWVEAAFRGWRAYRDTVFTDVRYENEVEAIRKRGGLIVRITREGVEAPNDHVSEHMVSTVIPDFDIKVAYNDLDELLAAAERFCSLMSSAND